MGASDVTSYGVINSCVTPRPEDEMPENSEDTSFYGLYDKMDDDADIVIVLGGINDWGFGRELGKFGDTGTETFCGAMNLLCSGLKEKYPNAEIFVFSSPQTDYVNNPANDLEGTEWEGNTEGYNCHGKKLGEYAKAMQTACVKQGIHFYSLTQAMPLSDSANSNVHPGVAKSVRIAELITNFIFDTYTK